MKTRRRAHNPDLFGRQKTTLASLLACDVKLDTLDGVMTIDLRALGGIEVIATEDGAYFRLRGLRGELRVIFASSAFFTLAKTFARSLT